MRETLSFRPMIRCALIAIVLPWLTSCTTGLIRHCDNVMQGAYGSAADYKAITILLPKRDFDDTREYHYGGCMYGSGGLMEESIVRKTQDSCETIRLQQKNPDDFYCMLYAIGGSKTDLQLARERAWTTRGTERAEWIEAFTAIASGVTAGLGGTPIAPQYRHLARPTSISHQRPAAAKSDNTCDGHPLQTLGDGPPGMTCRCSYGPRGDVDWWAVAPGDVNVNSIPCSAPGTGTVAQSPSAAPNLPAYPSTKPAVSQPVLPERAPAPVTHGTQISPSTPSPNSSQAPQYRPSFTHRGDIEREWIGGKQVSSYRVKVTNTGDVRLFCRASATGTVSYTDGGSCVGVSALNCTTGRTRTETRSSGVYPNNSVTVVTLGEFLRDGYYTVSCDPDP
jgi:hypothetical protein